MKRLSKENRFRKLEEMTMKKTWSYIQPKKMALRQRAAGKLTLRLMLIIYGKRARKCIRLSSHSMRRMFLTSIFKEQISNCNLRLKTTSRIYPVQASSSSRTCTNLKPKGLIKMEILRAMIRDSLEACHL